MLETSVLWLRAATFLYAFGLLHALIFILRRGSSVFPLALNTFRIAVVLHGVSLVELGIQTGHLPADNVYESLSLCAFLIGIAFLLVHARYGLASAGVAVFPLVFIMSLVGAMEIPVAGWTDSRVRQSWLLFHVFLILTGFAALLVTAIGSILYLLQERRLKSKTSSSALDRLPPLATLDNLITRAMSLGFVFITLGVIAGSTWAYIESGTRWFGDAKIVLSFVTWALCLGMVFLRASAGWRGRRAALMALTVLGCSALTWVAHVGLQPTLK
ncbi:MAG: cytochrome c biogenesis protein CcsA [Bryobacteraceae bacterium]